MRSFPIAPRIKHYNEVELHKDTDNASEKFKQLGDLVSVRQNNLILIEELQLCNMLKSSNLQLVSKGRM